MVKTQKKNEQKNEEYIGIERWTKYIVQQEKWVRKQ